MLTVPDSSVLLFSVHALQFSWRINPFMRLKQRAAAADHDHQHRADC